MVILYFSQNSNLLNQARLRVLKAREDHLKVRHRKKIPRDFENKYSFTLQDCKCICHRQTDQGLDGKIWLLKKKYLATVSYQSKAVCPLGK